METERVVAALKYIHDHVTTALGANSGRLLAPVSVRFARTTAHRLSLLYSDKQGVRAVIEVSTLLDAQEDPREKPGVTHTELKGRTLLLAIQRALVEQFEARVHWGQLLPDGQAGRRAAAVQFPMIDAARATLDAFDPGRVFVNDLAVAFKIRSPAPH